MYISFLDYKLLFWGALKASIIFLLMGQSKWLIEKDKNEHGRQHPSN
jgi:hypothetical protein